MPLLLLQTTVIEQQSFQQFISTLDWQNPSWDLLIIVLFLIAALLYGISLGRDRIIIILVSIYMALAVIQALPPFVLSIKIEEIFAFQITAFVGIFLVLFFFLSRSAILRTLGSKAAQGRLWQVLLLSFLHVGLLLSIALSFLPAEIAQNFAPFTRMIFTDPWARFGWITAPVLAMLLMGGGKDV